MTQAPRLRYYPRMPGRLDGKQLEQLIKKGEIDTVLTVFPDTFGRLLGKRVVGSYFLYHVAFVDEGGRFTVSEIWESKEQHDRWFSDNVEGVIPGIEQQVIKVHAVVTP